MKTFDHRVLSTNGLDDLIVEDAVKGKLRRLV
ncbi:hypothetical protein Pcac1_g6481 [Phytophthora cactorum]|nr:hypothetical protein Pcac1_g6481 [Phytophthora cactorum]KAG3031137.1 hypothetical protein PC120_g3305 [Phytophthora cactorum]